MSIKVGDTIVNETNWLGVQITRRLTVAKLDEFYAYTPEGGHVDIYRSDWRVEDAGNV